MINYFKTEKMAKLKISEVKMGDKFHKPAEISAMVLYSRRTFPCLMYKIKMPDLRITV